MIVSSKPRAVTRAQVQNDSKGVLGSKPIRRNLFGVHIKKSPNQPYTIRFANSGIHNSLLLIWPRPGVVPSPESPPISVNHQIKSLLSELKRAKQALAHKRVPRCFWCHFLIALEIGY